MRMTTSGLPWLAGERAPAAYTAGIVAAIRARIAASIEADQRSRAIYALTVMWPELELHRRQQLRRQHVLRMRALWASPAHRDLLSAAQKRAWERPERQERAAAAQRIVVQARPRDAVTGRWLPTEPPAREQGAADGVRIGRVVAAAAGRARASAPTAAGKPARGQQTARRQAGTTQRGSRGGDAAADRAVARAGRGRVDRRAPGAVA